jgi:hypothetical protein
MRMVSMFSKNGGKHRRDEKNHTCDESYKSIYDFRLMRDENNLMRDEINLTCDENNLTRKIETNSHEIRFISREMRLVSDEIEKNTSMFFSTIYPPKKISIIIIN